MKSFLGNFYGHLAIFYWSHWWSYHHYCGFLVPRPTDIKEINKMSRSTNDSLKRIGATPFALQQKLEFQSNFKLKYLISAAGITLTTSVTRWLDYLFNIWPRYNENVPNGVKRLQNVAYVAKFSQIWSHAWPPSTYVQKLSMVNT